MLAAEAVAEGSPLVRWDELSRHGCFACAVARIIWARRIVRGPRRFAGFP
jgi:hypothetical protein